MGFDLFLQRDFNGLIDLSPLSEAIDASRESLSALIVPAGRESVRLGELFVIEPAEGDGLTLHGDLRRAIRVGAGMAHGSIRVMGDVGAEAGYGMRGGTLAIEGNAGEAALSHMENGFAQIFGGAKSGLARMMRRGVIVVSGACGDAACEQMRGGTALLLDRVGENLARGMKRGTVLLGETERAPYGFLPAANVDLVFLRLLYAMLASRGVCLPENWRGGTFTRYRGDFSSLGKGEIFLYQSTREGA